MQKRGTAHFPEKNTFISPLENKRDSFRETVEVWVEEPEKPMSLGEYTKSSMEQIREYSDKSAPEPTYATLAHFPAMRVTFIIEEEGRAVEITPILTVRHNRGYTISYTAEKGKSAKFSEKVEKIIESFEIK